MTAERMIMVRPDLGLRQKDLKPFDPIEYHSVAELTTMVGAIISLDQNGEVPDKPVYRGIWRDAYRGILAETPEIYNTPLEAKQTAIRRLADVMAEEIEAPEIKQFKTVSPLLQAALDSGKPIDFVALGAVESVTTFVLEFVQFVLQQDLDVLPRHLCQGRNARAATALGALLKQDYQTALAAVLGRTPSSKEAG